MPQNKHFYTPLDADDELEQGNIFQALPFIEIDSPEIVELKTHGNELKPKKIDLKTYTATEPRKMKVVVNSILQPAIIITQNCDMLRSDFISYCRIAPFTELETQIPGKKKKRINFLVRPEKSNPKYYYLPIERPYGFETEMAVDFSCIQQIKKETLQGLLGNRKSTLNIIALEHFQEKMSHYFKRYAYNGWYVLNQNDFEFYRDSVVEAEEERTHVIPYDWQRS